MPFPSVSIVDLEQVNISGVAGLNMQPISDQYSFSTLSEKIRKPLVF